jgi:hypothetical protein
VGGKVLKKAMQFDKSLNKFVPRVVEALINHVALTPHPKNLQTYATATAYGDFMKSLADPKQSFGQVIDVAGKQFILAEADALQKAISTGGGAAGGTTPLGTNPIIPQSLEHDVKTVVRYIRSSQFSTDANATRRWFKSQGIDQERADAFAAYIAKNAGRISGIRGR